jgi:hypothetical protein
MADTSEVWALNLVKYVFEDTEAHSSFKIRFGTVGISLLLPNESPVSSEIIDSLIQDDLLESSYEVMFWECKDPTLVEKITNQAIPLTKSGQQDLSENTSVCIDKHMDGLYIFDRANRRILIWVPTYESFPFWAKATPFRIPFSWIAAEHGGEMIHCAAIDIDGQGILLAGNGGRGKTTTALNAALHGCKILGEDFILYMNNAISSVYLKAKAHHGEHLLNLISKGLKCPPQILGQKTIIPLMGQPFEMITEFKPSGLYFPGIFPNDATNEIVSIPKSVALREFAAPSFIGLQGIGSASLRTHSELVRSVETWTLPMTGNLDEDFARLKNQVESVSKR